jgi:arylamine N-acetyltransferase
VVANNVRVHVVNIVTLADGSKWSLDVGFGGDGPTKPLPLIDGRVVQNLGTQEIRLVNGNISQQLDKSQRLWIYQYRNNTDKPWNSFYCFSETEFIYPDFRVLNWYTSKHLDSPQLSTVLLVRYLRKHGENHIHGKTLLVNGTVKQNLGGRTVVILECKTEEERITALKEYFAIKLAEEEIQGIKGTCTELK